MRYAQLGMLAALVLAACGPEAGPDPIFGGVVEGWVQVEAWVPGDIRAAEPESSVPADVRCDHGPIDDPVDPEELLAAGPYEFDKINIEFVDPDRSTPPNGTYAGADSRSLDTRIFYPAGEGGWMGPRPLAEGGPFPLVVYSHGFSSNKDEATGFGEHLASYGYIVVAPTYPLTNMFPPGGELAMDDVVNQPGDVSFLIDQMLAKSALASDEFYGAVDEERIGVMGVSMGGMTSLLAAYHRTLHDPRIRAAVSLAGPCSFMGRAFFSHRAVPLLGVYADQDALVNYEANALRIAERARPNVTLVTIASGSHAGFAPLAFGFMLDLIGGVVAPEGAHPDNPDGLACGFVGDNLPTTAGFLEPLGGEENGIVTPDDPMPCDMAYLARPALDPAVQFELTSLAVLPFFEVYFGPDEATRDRSCHFVTEALTLVEGVDVRP